MPHYSDNEENIVYSTDGGRIDSTKPKSQPNSAKQFTDGFIRIGRETKGRKGKGVTTVTGIDSESNDIKKLAATLKKRCGTGGAVKSGIIEIQGDQRQTIKAELEKLGFKVKLSGG